jgi:uncharacterized protein involved in propanediol utilization
LIALGRSDWGGWLKVTSDVPVARGFGSSTSDVLATIRAVQRTFGCKLPDQEVARIAVRAEGASDSLMFGDQVVLFAQRDAVVVERLGRRFPRLAVLGFGTSPDGRGVDTLACPPVSYQDWEIRQFERLRLMLRRAVRNNDVSLLGAVASRSAMLNQRHLPVVAFEALVGLAYRSGAAGLQVAHSGDIAGLLFDASDPGTAERQGLARKLLNEIGITRTWSFTTGRANG